MKNKFGAILCFTAFLFAAAHASAQNPNATISFTISMEQPANHLFHVVLRCDGMRGAFQDFKMPVWTPGYYALQNFQANVENFHAEDGAGRSLQWEKADTNTWRVRYAEAPVVVMSYDVRATRPFVGTSFLDATRGYIMPAGVCMHPAGEILHPVTLTIAPNTNWSTIATGLDPVSPDRPHTYAATNFDILYDSPILMGNLDVLPSFEIQGVPHHFVGYNTGISNRQEFINNLKAVVQAGIDVIGDIPYQHYTFIAIGPGGGGIEHLNSTSFGFNGASVSTHAGMVRQLDFLAHEYFHHYNVKRIRPVELGPFDYDRANRTRMLWVSEGFTSYYEHLMLSRAGLMNQEELLDAFRRHMAAYENRTGHFFQSATQASWDVWSQGQGTGGGRGGGGASNRLVRTISYYEKGPVLGMLLDFKIRHETKNRASLDTAMRALYQLFYKDMRRGWTEEEFVRVCERVAGVNLGEYFDYAYTTRDVDYAKYLGYAGLQLEPPKKLAEPRSGVIVEDLKGKPVITAIEGDCPARKEGLAVNDEITTVNGFVVNAKTFSEIISSQKPGDKINLRVSREGERLEITFVLDEKLERSFRIIPLPKPDRLQAAILKGWMTGKDEVVE